MRCGTTMMTRRHPAIVGTATAIIACDLPVSVDRVPAMFACTYLAAIVIVIGSLMSGGGRRNGEDHDGRACYGTNECLHLRFGLIDCPFETETDRRVFKDLRIFLKRSLTELVSIPTLGVLSRS